MTTVTASGAPSPRTYAVVGVACKMAVAGGPTTKFTLTGLAVKPLTLTWAVPSVVDERRVRVATPAALVAPAPVSVPNVVEKAGVTPCTGLAKISVTVAVITAVVRPSATMLVGLACRLASCGGPGLKVMVGLPVTETAPVVLVTASVAAPARVENSDKKVCPPALVLAVAGVTLPMVLPTVIGTEGITWPTLSYRVKVRGTVWPTSVDRVAAATLTCAGGPTMN